MLRFFVDRYSTAQWAARLAVVAFCEKLCGLATKTTTEGVNCS